MSKYKFRKLKKPVRSSEFWYDISSGGYLRAEQFSNDPDTILAIDEAVKLLTLCEEMTGDEDDVEAQEA